MEKQQSRHFEYEVKDVTEWTKQTELAYWKSRAMALECENKMLLDYIKEASIKEIDKKLIETQGSNSNVVRNKAK